MIYLLLGYFAAVLIAASMQSLGKEVDALDKRDSLRDSSHEYRRLGQRIKALETQGGSYWRASYSQGSEPGTHWEMRLVPLVASFNYVVEQLKKIDGQKD